MWFGRRKSSIPVEPQTQHQARAVQDERETRRRNRLSKPLTSKISTSISTTSLQEPVSRSKNTSTAELVTTGPLSSHPDNPALRRQIRNQVFDSDRLQSMKNDSTWSVAYMVNQIDKKSTSDEASQPQEPPPSPPKPKKRASLLLRRLSAQGSSGLARSGSKERAGPLKGDAAASSTPDSSLDQIVDSPSIPPTRRASFTPGTATRKPSATPPKEDIKEEESVIEDKKDRNIVPSDDYDWQPPPPMIAGRVGTPASLNYSHLAGLRHGSLQIVNGRASPTFSEISKVSRPLLPVPKQLRDVSSDYGDADEESAEQITTIRGSSRGNTPDEKSNRRNFSWESNDDGASRVHPLQSVVSVTVETVPDQDEDQTSLMAKAYMAELPTSPFSSGSLRRSKSEGSLQNLPLPVEARSYSPMSPLEGSLSPSGSVIHRQRVRTDDDASRESVMSWYSPVEPRVPADEAFKSALEFQAQPSPTRLQLPRALEKSDSGYSSINSLRSLQMSKAVYPIETESLPNIPAPASNVRPAQLERRASLLDRGPSILKPRKMEPHLPTFANSRPAAISLNSAPAVTTSEVAPVKPAKIRKKLQKKRPLSQPPGKIAVTRVQSFDGDSVPQIPAEARENLQIRTQEVPELEQTYVPLNHMRNQASISNMNLPSTEIRFPSPNPEQEMHGRRSRSCGRPRSWIGRSKEDNISSRRNSGISQAEARAIINDFGTVASTLGGSPYDLVHGNIVSERLTSPYPYNISTVAPRRRSMMDDKAAAELARLRSRSIQERDRMLAERRPSFNDRGGIPGKYLSPASLASDAPPITPEMLQKAWRTSSQQQRQFSMGSGPAPPPPPHSPRPSYVDYEEDYSDMAIAPPPPSHSPRPMDITPDSWAAQAAAWKARKQPAGEALKTQSWDSQNYEKHHKVEDEPLYPVIPPRNPSQQGWTQRLSPEEYSSPHEEHYCGYTGNTRPQRQPYSSYVDSYHHSNEQTSAYMRQSRRRSAIQDYQPSRGRSSRSREPIQRRPLPSPRLSGSASRDYGPSSQSKAPSVCSLASSLAEELHPPDLEGSQPPPEFGRYSSGMGFGYERDNGFRGSARTRSVSGKVDGSRKRVFLRASFGVDLGDVPAMAMARG
ncbi:uncharacterized protein Z518_02234 [Rhinocladiella mackenziei CBS 650.93]|uniref:Uncharacterized protein n=1 Tax=Rhinocladiella mackenziei CBS 650.93 TaxID=1442369 RepID=A0A0D2IWC1_9EURO|nr:uncharacterized protein Z518_02234 [Rhinocladiella mackenziei CBS 650.93]KIX07581.1 hypothetical protein Z518_02234 [Rhinocladiella mackenziei CBS 650.93]